MFRTKPPLGYLQKTSTAALEAFELARLDRSSNLAKELRQVIEEWVAAEVEARIARCVLDRRRDFSTTLPADTFRPPKPFDRKQAALHFHWYRRARLLRVPRAGRKQRLVAPVGESNSSRKILASSLRRRVCPQRLQVLPHSGRTAHSRCVQGFITSGGLATMHMPWR